MSDDAQVLRQALIEVRNLLGPDSICDCRPEGVASCSGLREEAAESLRIAREALAATGSDDVLDALAERMRVGAEALDRLGDRKVSCGRVNEGIRLRAKAEGVRLALSYIEDAKRGVS